MNPLTQTRLRLMAVAIFVVGVVITWSGPEVNGVDWRWFFTCLFAGLALFALSFVSPRP